MYIHPINCSYTVRIKINRHSKKSSWRRRQKPGWHCRRAKPNKMTFGKSQMGSKWILFPSQHSFLYWSKMVPSPYSTLIFDPIVNRLNLYSINSSTHFSLHQIFFVQYVRNLENLSSANKYNDIIVSFFIPNLLKSRNLIR